MGLIKIVFYISLTFMIYGGCCSSQYLPECSCELTVDTTEYLIPHFASYSYPLERDYITEEVKIDSVIEWVKQYYQSEYIEASHFWFNWELVKDKLKNHDRIFFYSTVDVYGGIEGLIIVRNCKKVFDIELLMIQF